MITLNAFKEYFVPPALNTYVLSGSQGFTLG